VTQQTQVLEQIATEAALAAALAGSRRPRPRERAAASHREPSVRALRRSSAAGRCRYLAAGATAAPKGSGTEQTCVSFLSSDQAEAPVSRPASRNPPRSLHYRPRRRGAGLRALDTQPTCTSVCSMFARTSRYYALLIRGFGGAGRRHCRYMSPVIWLLRGCGPCHVGPEQHRPCLEPQQATGPSRSDAPGASLGDQTHAASQPSRHPCRTLALPGTRKVVRGSIGVTRSRTREICHSRAYATHGAAPAAAGRPPANGRPGTPCRRSPTAWPDGPHDASPLAWGRDPRVPGRVLDSAPLAKPEHATGTARPWPSVEQPTVRTDRPGGTDAVRSMSRDTATHRPTVIRADTRRDKKERPP
jgi:hypothetical protein